MIARRLRRLGGSLSRGYDGAWSFALPTVIVLVVGTALAACAARMTHLRNDRIAEARLAQVSDHAVAAIEERMALYEKALRGVRGAVAAVGVDVVTSEEFARYAETWDSDKEFPGMRGYGFIRRVARKDEATFVDRVRADGDPDFALRQLLPQEGDRYVIEFVAPVARNAAAVGLDVASEEHRRAAADKAMETGRATLSAPITLVQTSGLEGRGFLLFLPVLKSGTTADTPDAKRAATVGWAYAPLVIDEVLGDVDLPFRSIAISIRDKASGDVEFFGPKTSDETVSAISRTKVVQVYGREWVVATQAKPEFVAELGLPSPSHVALVVMVLTGLLTSLMAVSMSGRRTQRAAAAENNRLAAIVASAQDAIIGKTLDGIITDFNPAAERLTGFTAAEAVGRKAAELMIPEDHRGEEQWCLMRARRGISTPPHASWRMRRDGSQFHAQVSVAPIRSQGGHVIGVATIVRDSTEQVAADERIRALNATLERQVAERTAALQASSALQRAVIANAGNAVIATDLDGTITLFNPAAERLLGYRADEVVGQLTPAIFYDADEVARRSNGHSAEGGRPVTPGPDVFVTRPKPGRTEIAEWTYITKAGDLLPVLVTVSILLSDEGQALGYLGIAIDLSERYRHEAEMRAAEAGTWSYDVATGRSLFSAECARQHGLPDREVEIDVEREWAPLAHPDDVPQVLADLARAIEEGGGFTTDFRVPLPDGGVRWINARGRVEKDTMGRTVRVIGLTLDTTARKEAEIALSEAKAEAERANRAKTDFLAIMSHEIRTPLNAVIGFTDLMLASGRLDPGMRRQANLVRSSGAALLTVVNDILDFSKVEAGMAELIERPFALHTLLANCVAIVRGPADAKGLALRLQLDPALPRWVLGDESRLRQVLLNLLNNAVKFTAAGSVALDVTTGDGPTGDELRMRVIDTGVGIPPDKMDRLFRHFSQIDGSIQRDYGGTGLGLAICQRLVSLMGGKVEVCSEPGVGSTFAFTVRMPSAFPQEGSSPVPPARPLRRGRILLVDDSGVNRELAEAVLTDAGHTVQTVSDGRAAVEAVEAGRIDLVLMDIQMPGMDGMAATRAIRALDGAGATVPVIAMTANVLPEQIESYRAAGMDSHVGKPFDREELLTAVAGMLPPIDAAETAANSGLDETVYLTTRQALSPARMREVLSIFLTELEASFQGDRGDAASRAEHRHHAHTLCASSAMIGFTALSAACREVEDFDEARVGQEGIQAYMETVAKARELAEDAHRAVEDLFVRERLQQAHPARMQEHSSA